MKHLIINADSLVVVIAKIKNYAKKQIPFNIIIEPIVDKRTNKQLKYYWTLISIIQDWLNENGNNLTQEQTSDLMKAKFFNKIIILPNGEKRKILKSIANKSETTKKEMAEYITNIVAECTEWGIYIPIADNDYNF